MIFINVLTFIFLSKCCHIQTYVSARVFLTRALLASKANINEIQDILTNYGAGTADAFHVNAGFLDGSRCSRIFYSIEVTPSETEPKSKVMGGGRLGEGNNFYQKNNSPFRRLSFVPFGRVKLFLPVRGKNRMIDTQMILLQYC
ncbi:unnamed protein product [Aphis gossypii]|uniref:Uncharacterized protein n=1 Tax=Aphis gossypii TaxID=80765 RepID=A0A9P0IKM8_APHGO|nr:unnamed protein product [Aphis gossypii]